MLLLYSITACGVRLVAIDVPRRIGCAVHFITFSTQFKTELGVLNACRHSRSPLFCKCFTSNLAMSRCPRLAAKWTGLTWTAHVSKAGIHGYTHSSAQKTRNTEL